MFYLTKGVRSVNDEYIMLRSEIDNNIRQMHQYFSATGTAIIALFAYTINNPYNLNIYIFTAVFVALVCVASRVKHALRANVSIGTYMEIFLEPNIEGRAWETRSHYILEGRNSHELDERNSLMRFMFSN